MSYRNVRDRVVAMAGRGMIYRSFAKQFFISSRKNFYLYNILPGQFFSHLKIRVDGMTWQCRQYVYVKPFRKFIGHQVRGLSGALQYSYSSEGNDQQLETSYGVELTLTAQSSYVGSMLGFVAAVAAGAAAHTAGDGIFYHDVGPSHRKQTSLRYRSSSFSTQSLDIIGTRQLFLENNF